MNWEMELLEKYCKELAEASATCSPSEYHARADLVVDLAMEICGYRYDSEATRRKGMIDEEVYVWRATEKTGTD